MMKLLSRIDSSRCKGCLCVLLCTVLLVPLLAGCSKKKAAPPVPEVEVVTVVQKDTPIYATWVSSLDGNVNATIRPQVQGYLIKQLYREGELVKKGQVLFLIDPRPFQAALDQAKGDLSMNEARWEQAKANLARIKPLAAQNAVSKKDLDDAVGSEQSAKAAVEAARAEVERARLNLVFTEISSPIDGIAGLAKAQIGDLVGPSMSQELTTVSALDPIKAYISISERQYLWTAKNPKAKMGKAPLELILADGSVYPHEGSFVMADRQVDPATGTIKVTALFPNPDNMLRPGQFAKVRAMLGMRPNALLVPQRAVMEIQGTYQVAVIGPDNKADIRSVKLGDLIGNLCIIEQGLNPGERVVSGGIQKVKQGMTVKVAAARDIPDITPSSEPRSAPAPAGAK